MLIKAFIGNNLANQRAWLGSDVMVIFNILLQSSVQGSLQLLTFSTTVVLFGPSLIYRLLFSLMLVNILS